MDTATRTGTPLRQRMLEDRRRRRLEPRTQEGCIRAARKLAAFLKLSPDTATVEDLRSFQLHMVDTGTSRCTQRVAICNSRLLALDTRGLTFRWKDCRAKGNTRYKAMPLSRRSRPAGWNRPTSSKRAIQKLALSMGA